MVLLAIEGTLKEQKCEFTPAGYFAALLALLKQSAPAKGSINKDLTTTVAYLLDLVTSHVHANLLRSKFSDILQSLTPALALADVEASLLRSSIGCLESLLVAQDAPAWALPPVQEGPRKAFAMLLNLAVNHRPKVRKRAQDAITHILKNPPPSPALDHPVADMCAQGAMQSLGDLAAASAAQRKSFKGQRKSEEYTPGLMHALQLVKTVAGALEGWPSKKMEPLCKILMEISKSNNQYLTAAAFDVFEMMFASMAYESSSTKLPQLMEALWELRPSQNDSQLLPPWIAVLSRGYAVSAQVAPSKTFQQLSGGFETISHLLTSPSHNIRVSASECLISFLVNCVPLNAIIEPSADDKQSLEKLAKLTNNLLAVKYQAAWMEVFHVLSALFRALKWRSRTITDDIIKTVGELRGNDSFTGKKEADAVLGQAVEAMGPEALLDLLPLNLSGASSAQPGRAWLLPILRDHVSNTNLSHFRSEFVPLSESMYQRLLEKGDSEKSMQTKIFETLIQQIWATLPGYCFLPLDLPSAFDQTLAELLSNVLYKQTDLRVDVCRSLYTLVESNQQVLAVEDSAAEIILQRRVTKDDAQANLNHLSAFASNLLSVLFNVYSQTLPQFRGHILQCINAYLSITPANELSETFTRINNLLESALATETSQAQATKRKQQQQPQSERMPPQSHTLMDLVITIAIYLPSSIYPTLFSLAALILPQSSDPQLQKKAYKLLPRLATTHAGVLALQERNAELQTLMLQNASSATPPCRHDRLASLSTIIHHLPSTDLHFIPSILSEVVVSAKEVNERARTAAFDVLVLMARKMSVGGTISQSKIPHMASDSPNVQASLEEYFTMVSAGLVGSTPHMVSASITALTRLLYEFHDQLPKPTIEDMLETLGLFLTSASREIVRSVLGFVKVAIISLPVSIVQPRLGTLMPGLMSWSREHKAHFRSKVKHILERAIRRFGYEEVNKWTPEDDRKLLANIRKAKERAKRKKAGATDGDADEVRKERRKGAFESEYDAAIQSSSDDDEEANSDEGSEERRKGQKAYILEDEETPLDLLDRRAFGNISSSKPARPQQPAKRRGKLNTDGKLVVGTGESEEEDGVMDLGFDESGRTKNGEEVSLEGGINAYVDAIRGRDAVQRGRGGRLKFSNKREQPKDQDAMDVDAEITTKAERPTKAVRFGGSTTNRAATGGTGSGRGGLSGKKMDAKKQRRGLGMAKVSGGRVVKGARRMEKHRGIGGR